MLTKPLPTRWEAPASLSAPGTKKSTSEGSENVLHIPIHPSPVQGRPAGTGHTCPVCKPSGTWAHRLRLAKAMPRMASQPVPAASMEDEPGDLGQPHLGTQPGTRAMCQPCHACCHSHCLLSSFNVPAQPAPTAQPSLVWAWKGTAGI